ncbi:glycosyltransferase family 2 protein [Xylanibacter caecicola]|uniref:glycosyltransferase family 2 protein n=1 Tax=Xylanibacter caecicola TaxID=2736294 RepID=UPI0025907229|nr:glycosyltransferase family 2 protein [Xylanibacter caecicola]
MIKFTIITVTYNAADVFKRTADSVLAQKYPYVEHLIIDGASTDRTLEMAGVYKMCSDATVIGHTVIIKSEPDKGLYDAMNKGLDMATGHYVCFLNAGDFFPDSDTLGTVARNMQPRNLNGADRPLPAVLYGDTDVTDNEGNFLCHRRLSPPEKLTWRSFRSGMLVCHQAFYARTDIARKFHYDLRYRHSADVDWCIRVMKKADDMGLEMKNLHAVVACYQREGQSTRYHRASLMERFVIMCRHYGIWQTVVMHAWFVIRLVLKR